MVPSHSTVKTAAQVEELKDKQLRRDSFRTEVLKLKFIFTFSNLFQFLYLYSPYLWSLAKISAITVSWYSPFVFFIL